MGTEVAMPPTSALDRLSIKFDNRRCFTEDAPEHFLDPITMAVMEEPVVLLETKMVYDLSSIQEWFERGNRTCPMTNVALGQLDARSDRDLQARIIAWKKAQGDLCGPACAKYACQSTDTSASVDETLPPAVDFHFDHETYWPLLEEEDACRHERDIAEAQEKILRLLGGRVSAHLGMKLNEDGMWSSSIDLHHGDVLRPRKTEVFIAGRYMDFGNSGAKLMARLLAPRPNPNGTWAYNRSVTSLQCIWNKVGWKGAEAIAQGLQPHMQSSGEWAGNPYLKSLSLRRNIIGDLGAKAFAQALTPRRNMDGSWIFCTALEDLDLGCNSIGSLGVQALAMALTPRMNPDGTWVFPPLKSVDLYGNPLIGDAGIADLVSALLLPQPGPDGRWVYNPNLKVLILDGMVKDGAALTVLKDALTPRRNPNAGFAWNPALSLLHLNSTPYTPIGSSTPVPGEEVALPGFISSLCHLFITKRKIRKELNPGLEQLYRARGHMHMHRVKLVL